MRRSPAFGEHSIRLRPFTQRRTSTASDRTTWRAGARSTADTRPKAVAVTVKRLEILAFDGETARLEMQVGAGFYVRSLAHDLGDVLECGALLTALRRTRSGEFALDSSRLARGRAPGAARIAGRAVGPVPGVAAGTSGRDTAVGQPAGASQEWRGNGPRRPRRATYDPLPHCPAARP